MGSTRAMLHVSHHSRRSRRAIAGKLASICAFGKLAAADDGQQGMWTERATLTASDGSDGNAFGFSAALYEDHALVGARNAPSGGVNNAGAAYVFVKSGTEWHQQATLTASDQTEQA